MNIAKQRGFITFCSDPLDAEFRHKHTEVKHSSLQDLPNVNNCDNNENEEAQIDNGQAADATAASVEEVELIDSNQQKRLSQQDSIDQCEDTTAPALVDQEPSELSQSANWDPDNSEKESQMSELHEHFSQFYSMRCIVKTTFQTFKAACRDVQNLLAVQDLDSTDKWISVSEENTIKQLLLADPVILVFGGKGSGKSSLINAILGERILPSSSCMLRHSANGITLLRYDEEGYVGMQRSEKFQKLVCDGQERIDLQVRQFTETDMTEEERNRWAALDNSVLEIGCPNSILRTRARIIELPGDCFDPKLRERLLRQLTGSSSQTVLYVIDGNKGLGNSDRELLFFLKASLPQIRIFFIINKVDYDPEAEEMDCKSEDEEEEEEDEDRFHRSGQATQLRKRRLVETQLQHYRLAEESSVFPLSIMRLAQPLEGGSATIAKLNQQYQEQFQKLMSGLRSNLVEGGRSRLQLALSTLFLVSVRMFDAFTRDTSSDTERHDEHLASKDKIRRSFENTRRQFKELKLQFRQKLQKVYEDNRKEITNSCEQLEFGPLRLFERIRSNEVEHQYRDQISDYVLHLLNVEILKNLELSMQDLKTQLESEVESLKGMFCSSSDVAASSPWEEMIRTLADDIITHILLLNLSVEWKAEQGLLKWVKKLWSQRQAASKGKQLSMTSAQWKREVAEEFYDSINLEVVVKKMFAGVDQMLKQAEAGLMNLMTSRSHHAKSLQKLLLSQKDPNAKKIWNKVQLCVATAEGLRSVQQHKLLPAASLGELLCESSLGSVRSLRQSYAQFSPTHESRICVTVTPIWSGSHSEDCVQQWSQQLGGILNHHLTRGAAVCKSRDVAVTLLLTFSDRYQLSIVHSAYDASLTDYVQQQQQQQQQLQHLTAMQAFQLSLSLLQLWREMAQQLQLKQWSMQVGCVKTLKQQTAVYDLLESPIKLKWRGNALQRALGFSAAAEQPISKASTEQDYLLELVFAVLTGKHCSIVGSDAVMQLQELQQDEHKRRILMVKTLKSFLSTEEDKRHVRDRFAADKIGNIWFESQDRRVKCLDEALRNAISDEAQRGQGGKR